MKLTNESEEVAIENCMRSYIAKAFEKISQEYNPKMVEKQSKVKTKDFYGKALNRIPVWALKPKQYNHKIIKAYFTSVNIAGKATITMMDLRVMVKCLRMTVMKFGFGARLNACLCSIKIVFLMMR